MKKIILFILFSFSLVWQQAATAQTKLHAEKEFLGLLNSILKNSKQQHWAFEGVMTIDSAFAISPDGMLSVTVRYTGDSSFIRTRMEAPVNKIKEVAYDLYLILVFKEQWVTVYASLPGSNTLQESAKTNLFHIGAPEQEETGLQEKLQQALDKVLLFYR